MVGQLILYQSQILITTKPSTESDRK